MQHLFLIHCSPYASSKAKDSLDLVLATAAFSENIAVVFVNDGVFQLLKQQNTEASGNKNIAKTLLAFELYDIDPIYADEASLNLRNIDEQSILDSVKVISHEEIKALMNIAAKVSNLS